MVTVHCSINEKKRETTRGVKLILVKGPHTAHFDLKWARPVKSFLYV